MRDLPDIEHLAAVAARAADAARAVTLPYFRADGLGADNKDADGGFDPVTAADRAAEAAIRAVIAEARPEDAVLGEEEPDRAGTSGLTWVIDPIDGTRAFLAGLPTWGVLIGLDDGSRGILGLVDQPFTGERYVGTQAPGGAPAAWLEHADSRRAIRTRPCAGLAQATMMTTAPEMFEGDERTAFDTLRGAARLTRYGTDCYAYALVASGQIDLVVEAGLAPYDIAAPAALVQAAGGIATDWRGSDCRAGGRVVAAGDARVHAAAVEVLSRVD